MSDVLRIKFRKYGKSLIETTVPKTDCPDVEYVFDQLRESGVEVDDSGYTIMVDGTKADLKTTVRDASLIELVTKAKGGKV